MGTRADFYVGRGVEAEWLGSIAWVGHPHSIDPMILAARTESQYRRHVRAFLKRDDATLPKQGWPWPWEDSRTTDYAYAFDGGAVFAACLGYAWWRADLPEPDLDTSKGKQCIFPNMRSRQKINFGARSGLIVFAPKGSR